MVLAELLDTSFHSAADLRAYTTVPVLVNIPRIVTEADARRRPVAVPVRRGGGAWSCLVVVAGAVVLLIAHGNEQLAQLLSRGGRA